MAHFRNAMAGQGVDNWSFKNGVVSFNRGNKGFFAMAKNDFSVMINTGLPQGKYCDLISACARMIDVDGSGNAQIRPATGADPFVAIISRDGKPVDKFPGAKTVGGSSSTNSPVPNITVPNVTAQPSAGADYKRTVILIERQTQTGSDLFIDGGIDHALRQGCTKGVTPSPCSIPIRHLDPGSDNHYDPVKAWSVGDNYLDWNGAEITQGTYNGKTAHGTPAYWSTSDTTHPGYNRYNQYSAHYWVVEVEMDCSKTMSGYFEFKARVNGAWEHDINTGAACSGDSPGNPPFTSKNHIGRCGYLNIFHYDQKGCEINELGP